MSNPRSPKVIPVEVRRIVATKNAREIVGVICQCFKMVIGITQGRLVDIHPRYIRENSCCTSKGCMLLLYASSRRLYCLAITCTVQDLLIVLVCLRNWLEIYMHVGRNNSLASGIINFCGRQHTISSLNIIIPPQKLEEKSLNLS